MNKMLLRGPALFAFATMATAVSAQVDDVTAPNGPGRVYVRMAFSNANDTGLLNLPLDSSFVAPDAGLDLFHLREIPDRYGFDGVNDVGSFGLVTATSNILGTQVLARFFENNGVGRLTVTLPCRSAGATSIRQNVGPVSVVNFEGNLIQGSQYAPAPDGISDAAYDNIETRYQDPYAVRFTGVDPNFAADEAFAAYDQFLEGDTTVGPWQYTGTERFTANELLGAVYGCSVNGAGVNPLVGNAQSLQHQMVESGLDFTQPMFGPDEAPWGIGLRIGRTNRQGAVGTTYEARISRAFRLGEGSRNLLIVDLPVSYEDIKGVRTLRANAAVAARIGLSRQWSIEPRVSYGYVYAHDQGLKGQLAMGSVASLLMLDNIGPGALTIGNMIGYTKVLKAELYDYDVGNKTDNVVLRNGLAYELPLKGRMGGRQASVRTSYAMTNYLGDDLYTDTLHEATLSLGVRTRGSDIRNSYEVFRVGLIGKLGDHYKSGHLFIGYRF